MAGALARSGLKPQLARLLTGAPQTLDAHRGLAHVRQMAIGVRYLHLQAETVVVEFIPLA